LRANPARRFLLANAFTPYNRSVLTRILHSRVPLTLLLGAATSCAGCTAAFGPGYEINKQELNVQFQSAPEPVIRIDATYQLKNTGNRPLTSLELRLPGRRRFHVADPRAEWDKTALAFEPTPDNPRNVQVKFPQPWKVSSLHTLHLVLEYQRAAVDEAVLSFTSDAFFLPAQGWSPELLPARGIFATGGVPPAKWNLVVQIPDGFLVHTSGHIKHQSKTSRNGGAQVLRALQDSKDGYPFVVAGRLSATKVDAGGHTVNLWTRSPQIADALSQPSEALLRAIHAYDSMFGQRLQESDDLWIVECPVVTGCFSNSSSTYSQLIYGANDKSSTEMASIDTVMVDLTAGTPQIAAAAPSLAATWLGYGRNPGFFEQDPPLSALPAFASARGREAAGGSEPRAAIIRRVLRAIPAQAVTTQPPGGTEDATVVRAKSFLFFYGLQDRYGPEVCNAALRHMLEARRGGGFSLDDLIAALEQESHQNVAQFVRLWMKHPGVPGDFRARYEDSKPSAFNVKEHIP
jgi:hypothetical protein